MKSFSIVALTVALFAASTAIAQPTGTVKNNVSVPFAGTVFHPDTNENVQISGHLLVTIVAKYSLNPVKVLLKYRPDEDVTAIGQTSGDSYSVTGARVTKLQWWPAPIKAIENVILLTWDPPLPCPDDCLNPPLHLQTHLDLDATTGQITTSNVTLLPAPLPDSCTTVVEVCN